MVAYSSPLILNPTPIYCMSGGWLGAHLRAYTREKNVCLEEIGMWAKIGNHFKLNSQLNWGVGPMGLSYGAMTLNFEIS